MRSTTEDQVYETVQVLLGEDAGKYVKLVEAIESMRQEEYSTKGVELMSAVNDLLKKHKIQVAVYPSEESSNGWHNMTRKVSHHGKEVK